MEKNLPQNQNDIVFQTKKSFFEKYFLATLLILAFILLFAVSIYLFFQNQKLGSRIDYLTKEVEEAQNVQDSALNSLLPSSPIDVSPQPTKIEEINNYSIQNLKMVEATTKESPSDKYLLWLDGEHFAGQKLIVKTMNDNQMKLILEGVGDRDNTQIGDYSLSSPVWSPDSERIAYLRYTISELESLEVNYEINLHVVNVDGTSDTLIKQDLAIATGSYFLTDLSWKDEGIIYSDTSNSVEGDRIVIKI